LITLASRDRIPASEFSSDMVSAGLLMSYGTSVADVFRQVGVYAGSILKGVNPAELPVLQSTKFEFIINLQTARSLGLDVPPTLLARADALLSPGESAALLDTIRVPPPTVPAFDISNYSNYDYSFDPQE
jgi:putative ABC transport system substrate-binding protein